MIVFGLKLMRINQPAQQQALKCNEGEYVHTPIFHLRTNKSDQVK